MKRILMFVLVCVCLFVQLVPPVSAVESDNRQTDETLPVESLLSQYSCQYDRVNKKILLTGTVKHEALIAHKQYFLDIYRIPPGKNYEDVISSPNAKPLISTEISVRFEFALDINGIAERFSHYAVVLRSPSGERILASKPQYAEIKSNFEYHSDDFSFFKGLFSSEVSLSGNLGTGTAIVPVYLDRLLNTSSRGYIYTFGDKILYFDKAYIDILDRSIRTYSAAGSRVYLQFLLSANGSELAIANGSEIGAHYDMPNVFSEDVLTKICAVSEFVAERYVNHQTGSFHGIILGMSIDDPMTNYCGGLSVEQYAELYGLYLTAVSDSVLAHQSAIDMILPFSSENSYIAEGVSGTSYHCGQLLEAILKIQDDGLSIPFRCGVLVGMDSDQKNTTKLTVESMTEYSAYFNGLKQKYESAPLHYMVYWDVPSSMGPTAMCANYAYSYYKLICDQNVSSFVVSFSACENQGMYKLSEIKEVFRYIDTKDSISITTPLISYLGLQSWDEVIQGASKKNYSARLLCNGDISISDSEKWKGSFSYFDFPNGKIEDWFFGISCESLKSEYDKNGVRSLKGVLRTDPFEEYGELLCLYEFPERFVHTPYLRFKMAVNQENSDSDGLYQVMITLGNQGDRVVTQQIVKNKNTEYIWLDMSQYPKDALITYIKISVRVLGQSDGEIGVSLYDVTGFSEDFTSEELFSKIEADRMEIRNLTQQSGENNTENRWWILGLAVLGFSILVGIFICFKREDPTEENHKDFTQ